MRRHDGVKAVAPVREGEVAHVVRSKPSGVAVRPGTVPEDVLNLLWFHDGPHKNYEEAARHKSSVSIDGIKIEISLMGSREPSAIGIRLPITPPRRTDEIERPSYYPSYASLSPEQRWVYLDWLRNVESSIDIGYVFIFYYGLERHLFFGETEAAFDMISRLRKHHENRSLQGYSSNALIAACVFHQRKDLLTTLIKSVANAEEVALSDIYLLAKRSIGMGLVPEELMAIAKKVGFTNRRYLKSHTGLFNEELRRLLQDQFGSEDFSLEKYSLRKCPEVQQLILANYSLEPDQRVIHVPSILENQDFSDTVLELLQVTHERVKLRLREIRKGEQR